MSAVDFKDYYATLGVSRDATDDEIKAAFRKLARQYHPDVAKDKTLAEDKFKEINEAHEVLSDPVKRRKYDELGAHWQEEGASQAPPGWTGQARADGGGPAREFHFEGTGFSDFFEQFFGGGTRFGFEFGGGYDDEPRGPPRWRGADIEGEILVTLAEVMHGTIRPISLRSVDPRTGETQTQSFDVRIPAGAMEGRRIRVPGKGAPGPGGAVAGDLYLRVRYAAHPDYRTRGSDLYYDVDIAPWEAVLGASVVIPTLDGSIRVRIPAGTNPGAQLRVRGRGLPRGRSGERGDMYVVATVRMPPALTDEERRLWEQLQRASTFNPRETA